MHPAVFDAFEEICRERKIRGTVLEIGATPDDSTLLNLPSLAGAKEKVGINKSGKSRFKDFEILEVDANDMKCFPNQHFDAVLCNAVFEHDRYFWKTLAEIRRVVRVGGFVVIGAPGFKQLSFEARLRRWLARFSRFSRRPDGWPLQHSTLTLGVHNFPGDYYRFSEQTFREVFFEGMTDVAIRTVLVPPRIIGACIRV
jgi:SAM-dependent methyltransferase